MIYFNEEKHVYYDHDGYIFDSPSKILRFYKPKFPAKDRAKAYARKHGYTPAYWINKWKEISDTALDRGNKIHAEKEEKDFLTGIGKHKGKILHVHNAERFITTDLSKLPDGIYPEMVIWNEGWRISGKADRVILSTLPNGTRVADIDDYKSNKMIDKVGRVWNGSTNMMLKPVQHFPDSNYYHYLIQLSIYQYILETHGFVPGTRRIIHIPHPFQGLDGEWLQPPDVVMEVPYIKPEILNILKDYDRRRTFDKVKL